jgi:hypothetical protein
MKKCCRVLPLVIIAIACSSTKQSTKIEVASGISVTIPQSSDRIIKDSTNIFYLWKISFDDDQFAIYKYPITIPDSSGYDVRKTDFRKTIDAFVQAFTFKKIDSTYHFKDNNFQSNISFDFVQDNDDYRFFGRFLVNKNYFIAFCFQTPFPVDRFSSRIKDEIFNSIEIK